MYSDSDLEAAVAAGVLSPQAAASLRTFIEARDQSPAVDEEHFRLITGFNDVFVAIASALLLAALAGIGYSIGPRFDGDGPSPMSGVLVAAAAWGLAEFFTRRRRMALPSILLLLAFVGGVAAAVGFELGVLVGPVSLENNETLASGLAAGAAALAAVAAWFHWRRFRVPITVAAGAAAVVGLVMALISSAIASGGGDVENILLGFLLLLGIGVFLFAMWGDSSDPKRETRRADVAFWLHLLAAPMIVHPVFKLLGLSHGGGSAGGAVVVLLVYLLFALTALAIDRRALLVSALAYVLWALSRLFEQAAAGASTELSMALTGLVIGSALLLLSAFWHTARRAVVQPLPSGLRARLPVIDRIATTA
jgi:hypothetical protein